MHHSNLCMIWKKISNYNLYNRCPCIFFVAFFWQNSLSKPLLLYSFRLFIVPRPPPSLYRVLWTPSFLKIFFRIIKNMVCHISLSFLFYTTHSLISIWLSMDPLHLSIQIYSPNDCLIVHFSSFSFYFLFWNHTYSSCYPPPHSYLLPHNCSPVLSSCSDLCMLYFHASFPVPQPFFQKIYVNSSSTNYKQTIDPRFMNTQSIF